MAANADGLRETIRRRAAAAVEFATREALVELTVAAPYLTGATVDSAETDVLEDGPDRYAVEFRFTTPQALFTDEGTAPHEITGNPLLAFEIDGRTIVVASVQHPGTPRTGWFSDNFAPTVLAALERGFAFSS